MEEEFFDCIYETKKSKNLNYSAYNNYDLDYIQIYLKNKQIIK